MSRNRSSNQLVVPQARQALEQLKYEIASELGINFPKGAYHGDLTSRDAGQIGGNITRRLVQTAEQSIAGSSSHNF